MDAGQQRPELAHRAVRRLRDRQPNRPLLRGTMTIAGRTFTVRQDGPLRTLTVTRDGADWLAHQPGAPPTQSFSLFRAPARAASVPMPCSGSSLVT